MKKLLLITIALFSLTSNAQYKYTEDVFFGENRNNGLVTDLVTGVDVRTDNSICVEINLKNATVEVDNFGEVKIYNITKLEVLGDGYNRIYCSDELKEEIQVSTGGMSLAVIYNNSLMAFAEYPLEVQLKRSEEIMNDPRLDKETGLFTVN